MVGVNFAESSAPGRRTPRRWRCGGRTLWHHGLQQGEVPWVRLDEGRVQQRELSLWDSMRSGRPRPPATTPSAIRRQQYRPRRRSGAGKLGRNVVGTRGCPHKVNYRGRRRRHPDDPQGACGQFADQWRRQSQRSSWVFSLCAPGACRVVSSAIASPPLCRTSAR